MREMGVFFFFSSRRRHTRCGRDWSSDVCSSDLLVGRDQRLAEQHLHQCRIGGEADRVPQRPRSEEHTSELQSRPHLVCPLLLEKKKDVRYFLFLYNKKKKKHNNEKKKH